MRAVVGDISSPTRMVDVSVGAHGGLAFARLPSGCRGGEPLRRRPCRSRGGQRRERIAGASDIVTISLGDGSPTGAMLGSQPVEAVAGIATFEGPDGEISVDLAGTYTLVASIQVAGGATYEANGSCYLGTACEGADAHPTACGCVDCDYLFTVPDDTGSCPAALDEDHLRGERPRDHRPGPLSRSPSTSSRLLVTAASLRHATGGSCVRCGRGQPVHNYNGPLTVELVGLGRLDTIVVASPGGYPPDNYALAFSGGDCRQTAGPFALPRATPPSTLTMSSPRP